MFSFFGKLKKRIICQFLSSESDSFSSKLLSFKPDLLQYSIGAYSYGSRSLIVLGDSFNPDATLKIGKFCSIASNVTIVLGREHRPDWVTTYPFNIAFDELNNFTGHPKTKGSVTIGNDVWIGQEALILSGVTVGDGAVIGARSVVAKNVAPYTIVAGNPAQVIRKRFDDETITKLLEIKWWNWKIQRIKENMSLLLSNKIEEFIKKN